MEVHGRRKRKVAAKAEQRQMAAADRLREASAAAEADGAALMAALPTGVKWADVPAEPLHRGLDFLSQVPTPAQRKKPVCLPGAGPTPWEDGACDSSGQAAGQRYRDKLRGRGNFALQRTREQGFVPKLASSDPRDVASTDAAESIPDTDSTVDTASSTGYGDAQVAPAEAWQGYYLQPVYFPFQNVQYDPQQNCMVAQAPGTVMPIMVPVDEPLALATGMASSSGMAAGGQTSHHPIDGAGEACKDGAS